MNNEIWLKAGFGTSIRNIAKGIEYFDSNFSLDFFGKGREINLEQLRQFHVTTLLNLTT